MSNLFAKAKKTAPAKTTKAKADMISDELKGIAKDKWVELYQDTKKNPESVMIVQENAVGDTAQLMMVPSDKYITINEERAEELKETYGDDIVDEKTTFSFDDLMIEKYGEILSELIENCDEIPDKDKEKIIKATTSYSVAKGTIDKFLVYGEAAELMETVKPVVAIKNVEVIKG